MQDFRGPTPTRPTLLVTIYVYAPDALLSSRVKTKSPVYHFTIGVLGGAGFQSFEANLSWEICIAGTECSHRHKINCLRCTTSNVFFQTLHYNKLLHSSSSPVCTPADGHAQWKCSLLWKYTHVFTCRKANMHTRVQSHRIYICACIYLLKMCRCIK